MTATYAEFCAGYGGLGLAVEEVFGARLAWYSEFESAPSKIMAHHWPDAPNLGDMTMIDFTEVPRVEILSGGTPCQDLSHAGHRAGMRTGTRSGLWASMREAVAIIQPKYVVWENVRGAYSAGADSAVEQCQGCMGETRPGEHLLRALGRVLGDLADLGYDCQWHGLRAADVGAPHGRFRVFVLATRRDAQPANPDDEGLQGQRDSEGTPPPGLHRHIVEGAHRAPAYPCTTGAEGRPRAFECGKSPDWGIYAAAIRRWEAVRGTAPAATELDAHGRQRLSARLPEWMMGVPDGWITDVGISRSEQLKAAGNGVVPQQAAAALRDMLGV